MLTPINGSILVELQDDLEFVDMPDKQFTTRTRGICKAGNEELLDKLVFFEDYKDGAQVELDGKKYAFIKYEDVRGFTDEQTVS